jgi:putative ABC transport system permease protein
MFSSLRYRLRALFRRGFAEAELDAELRSHIEQQAEKYVQAGMSTEEATRRARLEFGGIEQVKEECRDSWGVRFISELAQDVRYGLRQLRRNPGFTVVAVITLALGIGSVTMIFSAIYGVILNTFPYKDSDRLARFAITDPAKPGNPVNDYLPLPEFLNVRELNRVFDDVIGTSTFPAVLSGAGGITLVNADLLSKNSFKFLGVTPTIGRWPNPEDTEADATPVFLMSYQLWRQEFNGNPNILGKSFTFTQSSESRRWLNGVPRVLIGIMPPRFRFGRADVWIPFALDRGQVKSDPNLAGISVMPVGRLKRGVGLRSASSNLNLIVHNIARINPSNFPRQFRVVATSFTEGEVGGFKTVIYPVFAAVVMLLLIACVNVGNLLLSRATAREREVAIRAVMGASRGRLIRQFLVETACLSGAACVVGCLFAYLGTREIVPFIPPGILPPEAVISLNPAVLLFSLSTSVMATALCGFAPILHVMRGELQPRLVGVAADPRAGILRDNFRGTLVVAEVALSIVLLAGAFLVMRTFFAMKSVDFGFNPRNLLVTAMYLPRDSYGKPEQRKLFVRQVLDRVTKLPGVIAATPTMVVPPFSGPAPFEVTIPGSAHSEKLRSQFDMVSEGYFRALGLRLLRGRLMSAEDVTLARPVTVVNETLARSFFGNGDPIGRHIKFNSFDKAPQGALPHDTYFEIIGVVTDIRNRGMKNPPAPEAYLPYTVGAGGIGIIVRTAADPNSLLQELIRQIWAVDRSVTPINTGTVESVLQRDYYEFPEFDLATLGVFALIGLLLVIAGIFSVMAYKVSLRTHEIGIRMALGAERRDVLGMVLRQGLKLTLIGLIIGIAGALVLSRFLANLLYGVTPTDPLTFMAVSLILLAVALLACYIPARRAARVDPMVALRYE